jgi:hypothetical protein
MMAMSTIRAITTTVLTLLSVIVITIANITTVV